MCIWFTFVYWLLERKLEEEQANQDKPGGEENDETVPSPKG